QAGMPIYAECGGFMVLCESLDCVDAAGKAGPHVMTGVIPAATSLCAKPQGLGYTESVVEVGSPFFLPGETVLGHEFHYSVCLADPGAPLPFSLRMLRGSGIGGGRDGVLYENTFAGYTHIHALAAPAWAPRFVAAAARWRGSVDSGLSEEQT
ncbi:MAG: cobyrinic acid a,c-diamide synthase, partial [Proteobacteria bacterium]|nr:cobyrinic acid a,c-diamide synthase [Pseudomonadota bacterium]